MNDATRAPSNVEHPLYPTARLIATQVEDLEEVLDCLGFFRDMGDVGAPVVEAIEAIRPVRLLDLSWRLFEILAEDDELTAFELMVEIGCVDEAVTMINAFTDAEEYCDCEICADDDDVVVPFGLR